MYSVRSSIFCFIVHLLPSFSCLYFLTLFFFLSSSSSSSSSFFFFPLAVNLTIFLVRINAKLALQIHTLPLQEGQVALVVHWAGRQKPAAPSASHVRLGLSATSKVKHAITVALVSIAPTIRTQLRACLVPSVLIKKKKVQLRACHVSRKSFVKYFILLFICCRRLILVYIF